VQETPDDPDMLLDAENLGGVVDSLDFNADPLATPTLVPSDNPSPMFNIPSLGSSLLSSPPPTHTPVIPAENLRAPENLLNPDALHGLNGNQSFCFVDNLDFVDDTQ